MPGLFSNTTGQPSKQQNQLYSTENQAIQFGLTQAESTLPQAAGGLNQSMNFFQQLLTGNQNALASVLGPDISTLTSQYETSERSNTEFAPRGGGATAANEEARFQEAGQIQNLFSSARTEGAEGTAAIAQMLGQLGLGELGTSSSTAGSLASQLLSQQQNEEQQTAALGSAAGGLIALLVGAAA
jgi:hypothetical protein